MGGNPDSCGLSCSPISPTNLQNYLRLPKLDVAGDETATDRQTNSVSTLVTHYSISLEMRERKLAVLNRQKQAHKNAIVSVCNRTSF